MVLSKNDYEKYLTILERHLVLNYNLSKDEARRAILSSSVEKMLHEDEDCVWWQLHQPILATTEEIFEEYTAQ